MRQLVILLGSIPLVGFLGAVLAGGGRGLRASVARDGEIQAARDILCGLLARDDTVPFLADDERDDIQAFIARNTIRNNRTKRKSR